MKLAKENEKESNQSGLMNISVSSWLEEMKEISKYRRNENHQWRNIGEMAASKSCEMKRRNEKARK
jgi:hypothetical protein